MADLGKMYGPLPLGAWGAALVGGFGILLYTRHQTASAATVAPAVDTSGVPGVGDGSVGGGWVSTQPATGTTSPDPKSLVTDNDSWGAYVEQQLIGRYNYDPNLVDSAIRKYLSGEQLSTSEYVVIRQALLIMVPPVPLPSTGTGVPVNTPFPGPRPPVSVPGPVTIPSAPPPTPAPSPQPHVRYYTVVHGDTLWGISQKYYHTGVKWPVIFSANMKGKRRADGSIGMISNPGLILPGWKLIIPN